MRVPGPELAKGCDHPQKSVRLFPVAVTQVTSASRVGVESHVLARGNAASMALNASLRIGDPEAHETLYPLSLLFRLPYPHRPQYQRTSARTRLRRSEAGAQ
jgi:hypothetical protein